MTCASPQAITQATLVMVHDSTTLLIVQRLQRRYMKLHQKASKSWALAAAHCQGIDRGEM